MRDRSLAFLLLAPLLVFGGAHAITPTAAPLLESAGECRLPSALGIEEEGFPPELDAEVSTTVLDTQRGAGTDVELFRTPAGTILLAHKRHTGAAVEDGVPVELVVLRSEDAGATWSERVVDADLMEGSVVAEDVSFAVSGGAVYLTYAWNRGVGTHEAVLRLARSDDDGATWTTRDAGLPQGTGGYASLGEVEPGRLLLALTHLVRAGRFAAEVPAVAESADGGETWTLSALASPVEHGGAGLALATDGVGGAAASWYNPAAGTTSSQKMITASREGDAAWRWSHTASGCVRAGLGPDAVATGPGRLHTSYFNWSDPIAIELATTLDAGAAWEKRVVDTHHIRRGATGSWLAEPSFPTAVDAASPSRLVVAYGWSVRTSVDPLFRVGEVDDTLARLAVSDDGGATWAHRTLDLDAKRGRYHDVLALPGGDALVAIQVGVEAEGRLVLLRVGLA